jgi:hypothetical protein
VTIKSGGLGKVAEKSLQERIAEINAGRGEGGEKGGGGGGGGGGEGGGM